jgi:hypothetical protein
MQSERPAELFSKFVDFPLNAERLLQPAESNMVKPPR